ncbi:hypothetical protein DFA_10938 [Cavenderia fasciculata]|uniref:Ankyrin repeat-containing protein n=1 Tax=Cavenderia fasciculata TaxID=261658 RepID=F4QBU2_CACFS|nr:uncharacterized protein DFA_10938 [Cavenderia fasciculata]EGG14680.1 hypothetical protein DFA_10938 [Cavenderia fasciculata]|eukprot:XP_004351188.1 hypothetical protein DFA_10938 [Cavenderia fasciculata]
MTSSSLEVLLLPSTPTRLFLIIFKNVVLRDRLFYFVKWIHRCCRMDVNTKVYTQNVRRGQCIPITFKMDGRCDPKQPFNYFLNPMSGRQLNAITNHELLVQYNRPDLLSRIPSLEIKYYHWAPAIRSGCHPDILKIYAQQSNPSLKDVPLGLLKSNFYFHYKDNLQKVIGLIDVVFILQEKNKSTPLAFEYSSKFFKLLFKHSILCQTIINHFNQIYNIDNNNNSSSNNDQQQFIILRVLELIKQYKTITINWKDVMFKAIKSSNVLVIDFIVSSCNTPLTSAHLNYAIWNGNVGMIEYLLSLGVQPNQYTLHSALNPKSLSNNDSSSNEIVAALDIISLVLERLIYKSKWVVEGIHPKLQSIKLLDQLVASDEKVTLQPLGDKKPLFSRLFGSLIFSKDKELLEHFINQHSSHIIGLLLDYNYAFNCALRIGSLEIVKYVLECQKQSKLVNPDGFTYQIDYIVSHDADNAEILNYLELVQYAVENSGGTKFSMPLSTVALFLHHPNPEAWRFLWIVEVNRSRFEWVFGNLAFGPEKLMMAAATCSFDIITRVNELLGSLRKPCHVWLKTFKRNINLDTYVWLTQNKITQQAGYRHFGTTILQRLVNIIDMCHRLEYSINNSLEYNSSIHDYGHDVVWNGVSIKTCKERAQQLLSHIVRNKDFFNYYTSNCTTAGYIYIPLTTSLVEDEEKKRDPSFETTMDLIVKFIAYRDRLLQFFISQTYKYYCHKTNGA